MTQDTIPPLPKSSSNASGCIIGCLIVLVIALVGAGLVGYSIYRAGVGTLDAFTESEARPIPEVTMTGEEQTAAEEKLSHFMTALKAEENDEKVFEFTGQEINVMLRSNEAAAALGESVHVTIENGVVTGEVSLDIGQLIPLPFLQGRFANGEATFSISSRDERLFVFVEDFRVKGEQVPEEVLQKFRQTNLAEDAMSDPDFRAFMQNVDAVDVVGDKLVVTLK